jgi:hypothetical protein
MGPLPKSPLPMFRNAMQLRNEHLWGEFYKDVPERVSV